MPTFSALAVLLAGTAAGLSLIVAVGAQNAYVLRRGIEGVHVGVVVAFCIVSDALLISLGTAGVGMLVEQLPSALVVVRWLGVAFLAAYAVVALRRAVRPVGLTGDTGPVPSRWRVLAVLAAVTWLNPHTYLDVVVLLGSLANSHGPEGRWWFSAGALAGSMLWFPALGFGATRLAPLFARASAWRVLDLAIFVMMAGLAGFLALGA